MKFAKLCSAIVLLPMLTGCAAVMTRNGAGLIYTDARDSVAATAQAGTSKEGQSCATNILALVSTGDTSIDAGKKVGGITKVASVDYSQYSILGVYAKTCVIVRGE